MHNSVYSKSESVLFKYRVVKGSAVGNSFATNQKNVV